MKRRLYFFSHTMRATLRFALKNHLLLSISLSHLQKNYTVFGTVQFICLLIKINVAAAANDMSCRKTMCSLKSLKSQETQFTPDFHVSASLIPTYAFIITCKHVFIGSHLCQQRVSLFSFSCGLKGQLFPCRYASRVQVE